MGLGPGRKRGRERRWTNKLLQIRAAGGARGATKKMKTPPKRTKDKHTYIRSHACNPIAPFPLFFGGRVWGACRKSQSKEVRDSTKKHNKCLFRRRHVHYYTFTSTNQPTDFTGHAHHQSKNITPTCSCFPASVPSFHPTAPTTLTPPPPPPPPPAAPAPACPHRQTAGGARAGPRCSSARRAGKRPWSRGTRSWGR